MTTPAASPRSSTPPKRVLLVAVFMVGVAAWLLAGSFTSAGARECGALYHAARTAADTARVDSTVTPGSSAQSEPHTCGFMRIGNRWQ